MNAHRIRVAKYSTDPWSGTPTYRVGCTCGLAFPGQWGISAARDLWKEHERAEREWCPEHRQTKDVEERFQSDSMDTSGPRLYACTRLECGCTLSTDLGAMAV